MTLTGVPSGSSARLQDIMSSIHEVVLIPEEARLPVLQATRDWINKAFGAGVAGMALYATLAWAPVLAQGSGPDLTTGDAGHTLTFEKRSLSPYELVADASGTTLKLKDTGDRMLPSSELALHLQALGYDKPTQDAILATNQKMEQVRRELGPDARVVLGVMISNSRIDTPKLFKDTTHKPTETLEALCGTTKLTKDNYEKVFDTILAKTLSERQVKRYKARVTELGSAGADRWFWLFNQVVSKMPAQNISLISELLITTSSIAAYIDPAMRTNLSLSPSVVADQLYRLLLLVSGETDFSVARATYGENLETAASRRLPNRAVIKKVLSWAGITLPQELYDIAEAGARDMGIGTGEYAMTVAKKQEWKRLDVEINKQEQALAGKEQVLAGKEQALAGKEQVLALVTSTKELFTRINTNILDFIKNTDNEELLAVIRQDMIALRKVRAQWESLPPEQKQSDVYKDSIGFIIKTEKRLTQYNINV